MTSRQSAFSASASNICKVGHLCSLSSALQMLIGRGHVFNLKVERCDGMQPLNRDPPPVLEPAGVSRWRA